jgi:hypothetical protein
LVNAEFVLLVDHHQPQVAKLDVLLEQRDGADDDVDLAQPDLARTASRFLPVMPPVMRPGGPGCP